MERYRLTVTNQEDETTEISGISIEEVLNVVLNETAQEDILWVKIERLEG